MCRRRKLEFALQQPCDRKLSLGVCRSQPLRTIIRHRLCGRPPATNDANTSAFDETYLSSNLVCSSPTCPQTASVASENTGLLQMSHSCSLRATLARHYLVALPLLTKHVLQVLDDGIRPLPSRKMTSFVVIALQHNTTYCQSATRTMLCALIRATYPEFCPIPSVSHSVPLGSAPDPALLCRPTGSLGPYLAPCPLGCAAPRSKS